MSAAGHTPGPWTWRHTHHSTVDEWPGGPSHTKYRLGQSSRGQRILCADTVRDADARLIAAAPDLLAALEEACERIEDSYDGAPDSPTRGDAMLINTMRAAIARATGGSRE